MARVMTQARQPGRTRLYCDLGTNLDEGFIIWNQSWYAFWPLPVTRRAACVADSPGRIARQAGDCPTACAGTASSIRTIGSADQARRVSDFNPHLIRTLGNEGPVAVSITLLPVFRAARGPARCDPSCCISSV